MPHAIFTLYKPNRIGLEPLRVRVVPDKVRAIAEQQDQTGFYTAIFQDCSDTSIDVVETLNAVSTALYRPIPDDSP